MKAIAKALYTEPVVFLGVVQAATTTLAAVNLIAAWIPVLTLAIVTVLQRRFVAPHKRKR